MKRQSILLVILVILSLAIGASGAGNETHNPMPPNSPNLFYPAEQTFLKNELPNVMNKYFKNDFVRSGGLHSTSNSCVSGNFSLDAFTSSGNHVTADGHGGQLSIVYNAANIGGNCNNDVCWVAGAGVDTPTIPNSNFQQVGQSNIYVNCSSDIEPTWPADSVRLMKVTLSGGQISDVKDLRRPASYITSGYYDIADPLYGADPSGVADSTAAIQAVLDAPNAEIVKCTPGNYKITNTLTFRHALMFFGPGAGPGGVSTTDRRWKGCALEHHFNGTFLLFSSYPSDVISSVGIVLKNVLLRQNYGTGSGAAGIAVLVQATNDNSKASWVRIESVNTEYAVGAVDDWTWGIYFDGNPTSSTVAGGSRGHVVEGGRYYGGTHSSGGISIQAGANIRLANVLINGIDAAHGSVQITGSDASHISANTTMSNLLGGTLALDYALNTSCGGCQFANVTTTANTQNFVYQGIALASSLASGASGISFYTNTKTYISSTIASDFHLSSASGSATVFGLGTDGVDRFQWTIDASTGALKQYAPAGVNYVTVDNNGVTSFNRPISTPVTSYVLSSGTLFPSGQAGNVFTVALDTDNAVTIGEIDSAVIGQPITLIIRNSSSPSQPALAWSACYHMAPWVHPAVTMIRSISFIKTGSCQYREISRTPADVQD
jgi:hypothetical protein